MNARKLIENEDEDIKDEVFDIKDEVFDVPYFVTTVLDERPNGESENYLVYLTQNRRQERPRDKTFNIGREWFNWQWSARRATAFSWEKATNLVVKLQKIWTYKKFNIMPAVRPDAYVE